MQAADQAQNAFRTQLLKAGQDVMDRVRAEGRYAVVLASRPYHNDALVNHDLPELFASMGVPVLPADALPGTNRVDLSRSRLDIANNYHARVLSSAILAAQSENLEYVQLVQLWLWARCLSLG